MLQYICVYGVQEEVSIAKEEWELGHLKAIKEQDERRAEIEEDDMLYLESSPSKSLSAGKHGRSKPKLYSYGGWEFASFDEDVIASFLDDDGSQNVADDTSTEPVVVNSRLASVPRSRDRKRKSHAAKKKPAVLKTMNSPNMAPKRKLLAKKRHAEFGNRDDSTEKRDRSRKRLKILPPKIAKIPVQKPQKKIIRPMKEKDEHVAVGSVTVDGKNVGHRIRARFASPDVRKVPRLQAVKQFSLPTTVVQHRPLVRPVRSSELGIQPRMVRVPVRTGARTVAQIGIQSPPQPTPILEKLGATVLASPSSATQPSRLTQIVSSISALQNSVIANASLSPGTVQYVITTNGRPAIQPVAQTPLVIGTSASPVGGNLRSNVIYHVPPVAGRQQLPLQTAVQSISMVKPSQPSRLVLSSSATSVSTAKQSFVLTAPGGDRQSFMLLPTSNRQSYILAPAASASPPSVVASTASTMTQGAIRPTSFTVQLSPPRLPRTVQQQQLIQPAPIQRTIQLAPSPPRPAANTQPILEKFALQLNAATQPAVAATYEVVAHSGELIATASPSKVPLQQIVYPTVSPPSQIVRLPGSTGTSGVQLVVGAASVAKPVQTITMPQFVIRQPRQVNPASSVIAAAPAVVPVRGQLSAPRIVSGTNLVQVPSSQLSTVIILDSSQVSQQQS